MKHVKQAFVVLILFVLGYFFLGEFILEPDVVQGEYRCEEFCGEWFRLEEDATRSPIEIPGKYEVERNELMTVQTVLPETIPSDSCLSFRSAK